jgi:hypothetical protein
MDERRFRAVDLGELRQTVRWARPGGRLLVEKKAARRRLESVNREASNRVDRTHSTSRSLDDSVDMRESLSEG